MRIINSFAPQKGITLITILIVLLLVTAIGALAIKQAITSLRISTNGQVHQLLMQSADLPLYLIRNTDPTVLRKLDNVIGLAINNNFPDREYVFCYRPTAQKNLAPLNKVAEISALTTTGRVTTSDQMRLISGGNDSFCDLTKDFGSARTGVITQVAVSMITEDLNQSEKGEYLPKGTDSSGTAHLGSKLTGTQRFRVTTTAMLPAYSKASLDTVQSNCLSTSKPRLNDNTEYPKLKTLSDCLIDYGVPVVTQTQEFTLANMIVEISKPN